MDELKIGTPTRKMSKQARESAAALNALLSKNKNKNEGSDPPPSSPPPETAPSDPVEIPLAEDASIDDLDDGMRYAGTHVDNPKTRRAVEARCGEIDFDELLISGKVSQKVPIIPGKYEVIFQSVGGDEDLFIKSLVFQEDAPDGILMDKYSYMRLSIFVKAINGQLLPDYRNEKGEIDPEAFKRRWRFLSSRAEPELEILSCNARWFHDRTQRMWVVDALKNG